MYTQLTFGNAVLPNVFLNVALIKLMIIYKYKIILTRNIDIKIIYMSFTKLLYYHINDFIIVTIWASYYCRLVGTRMISLI